MLGMVIQDLILLSISGKAHVLPAITQDQPKVLLKGFLFLLSVTDCISITLAKKKKIYRRAARALTYLKGGPRPRWEITLDAGPGSSLVTRLSILAQPCSSF